MILTGSKIREQYAAGNITLDPYEDSSVNPNSYNYRLGPILKEFDGYKNGKSIFKEIHIPEEGYVLKAKQMYLGHTYEVIGSTKYAMSLIGRSSIGRLGMFLQLSANLGHTTSCHQWTLEIYAIKPFRVYPKMFIGQVSFWSNCGKTPMHTGYYANFSRPHESCAYIEEERIQDDTYRQ